MHSNPSSSDNPNAASRQTKGTKGRHKEEVDRTTRCLTLLTQNVRGLAKNDTNIQTWFGGFRKLYAKRLVDVVFLQETRANHGWADKLRDRHARSWGHEPTRSTDRISFWQQPERAAGGVAILLHPRSAFVNARPCWEEHWSPDFMAVTGEFEGDPVTLVNVYGSSSSKEAREALFERLKALDRPNGMIVLGGDFNCVIDREMDRSRTSKGPTESPRLQELLEHWRLTDATAEHQLAIFSEADKRRFHAEHHTYRYPHGDSGIASSRLDRWYIPTTCLKRLARLQVTQPLHKSDHDAVWLRLTEPSPPQRAPTSGGRRALRYPMTEDAKTVVADVATRHLQELAATADQLTALASATVWDDTKTSIKSTSLAELRLQRKRIKQAYRQRRHRLRAHLRTLQTNNGPIPPTVSGITAALAAMTLDRQAEWRRTREELIGMSEAEVLRQRQRTFAVHAGTGADAVRAFYNRIATKFQRRPQTRTRMDGNRMAKDWTAYTQRGPLDEAAQDAFFAQLPPPQSLLLTAPFLIPFSEADVAAAIAACPRGKASGPDGLPNDWYRDHADLLTPLLTRLFNKWHAAGVLPQSFSNATIFCIPKKPAPKNGLDFRPIALLNTDYKIYSRLLLSRVKDQLERVVSPSQFGFVPNRQVHDALDVWAAIANQVATGAAPQSTTAILLDFAKAYDTLDRRFLTLALRRLGAPDLLVQAVEGMHLGTTAAYLAEDTISDKYAILNGIRQGCPLAPVLFVLAVDTLYAQLETTPGINGVRLPSGTVVTTAGFADDTIVYLSSPDGAIPLRQALEKFATVSGLAVNVEKCVAIAMAKTGWDANVGDIGFPRLPADQMARALGIQVSSALNVELVWELTVKQLQSRLVLAQARTTDVLQRAQVAQAIIVPKLMYIGRHTWPTAGRIRTLQKLTNNYVWHGRFVEDCSGRAWMNHDSATLRRRDGGIALPDLASEFLQLSVSTHLRWSERATGLRSEIGALLGGLGRTETGRPRPQRHSAPAPSLRVTGAATGSAIVAGMCSQPRQDQERVLCGELLERVGRGTMDTRWWGGAWYFADHHNVQTQLLTLRNLQTAAHGSFNFHGLMTARICGDGVFLAAHGRETRASDFPGLVRPMDRLGDVLEIQWAGQGRARFRCKTMDFPLPPQAARSFRRLCDIVVFNYPAVLAPHDPEDVVRVQPATIDSWRLRHRDGPGFDLIWEPTAGIHIDLGEVRTVKDVTARVRKTLDAPTARALDHEWLGPLRAIWHPRAPVMTKGTTKRHVRAAKSLRDRRENEARSRRLTEADPLIGQAQAQRTWTDIDKFLATTSRQRLKLRQIKGNRIPGWDRLHQQHGCPHCADARDGGAIPHIFWACPAAQELWSVLSRAWAGEEIWHSGLDGETERQQAIFDLRLPSFPGRLWKLPDLARISPSDTTTTALVHNAAQTVWQQQVLVTKEVIWKWRHNVEDGVQQWTTAAARTYLVGALKATTRGLLERLPRDHRLRDPRRQLLRAMAGFFEDPDDSAPQVSPAVTARTVLFFDGGSRGNPGPGGAGAVLVAMNQDTTQPRVLWSACMSYQQADMTNNQAEYLGAIAGLREAKDRGLRPEVVGDSALVLRQLQSYRPPKNARLRPLYSVARRLADEVRVETWHHHLRAYNKMADAAANTAMDLGTSIQVSHPSARPHTAAIDALLASDFHEWHTRHRLREAQT